MKILHFQTKSHIRTLDINLHMLYFKSDIWIAGVKDGRK